MAVVGNSSVVLITGGLQAVSDNYLNDPSMSEITKTILFQRHEVAAKKIDYDEMEKHWNNGGRRQDGGTVK